MYISHGLPGQGRPAELPGGDKPKTSNDEYSDAGPLLIPACPGHCGHSGREKPLPPIVHPMRHDGPPEGTERQAPRHSSVRQGSIVKEAAANGGGSEGDLGEFL